MRSFKEANYIQCMDFDPSGELIGEYAYVSLVAWCVCVCGRRCTIASSHAVVEVKNFFFCASWLMDSRFGRTFLLGNHDGACILERWVCNMHSFGV